MAVMLISSPADSDENSMLALVSHATDIAEEDLEAEDELLGGTEDQDEDEELFRDHSNSRSSENRMSNSSSNHSNLNVTLGHPQDSENLKPSQVVKTREFWILWLTLFLNNQAISYINAMYKAYGQTFIKDDHFLAIVGAFAAIFNSSGRIFWGHLADNFGYRCEHNLFCKIIQYSSYIH